MLFLVLHFPFLKERRDFVAEYKGQECKYMDSPATATRSRCTDMLIGRQVCMRVFAGALASSSFLHGVALLFFFLFIALASLPFKSQVKEMMKKMQEGKKKIDFFLRFAFCTCCTKYIKKGKSKRMVRAGARSMKWQQCSECYCSNRFYF